MKRLVAAVLMLVGCSCVSPTHSNFVGKWENDNGVIIKITDGQHFKWGGIEDKHEVYGWEGRYELSGSAITFTVEHSECCKVPEGTIIKGTISGPTMTIVDGANQSEFRKKK